MNSLNMLAPPAAAFEDVAPDRSLFGHGEGVFDGAEDALWDAVSNARRRFLRALVANGVPELRAMIGAIG